MSGIILKNVYFSYGEQPILKDITLSFKKGTFNAVIGPNGAGKTTLLRMISGYLKPTGGNATLNGVPLHTIPVKKLAKYMALVPQSSSMDYHFTVEDIVLTGRHVHISKLRGETQDDYEIGRRAMEQVNILHLKDRSVTTLSGGEWQRMIIARAICQQSEIILLDEPVSNLDILNQVEILKTIQRTVEQTGITAICVLHDLSLTLNFCDTVTVIANNRLFAHGKPKDILTQENILSVYGMETSIVQHEGGTYVLPKY